MRIQATLLIVLHLLLRVHGDAQATGLPAWATPVEGSGSAQSAQAILDLDMNSIDLEVLRPALAAELNWHLHEEISPLVDSSEPGQFLRGTTFGAKLLMRYLDTYFLNQSYAIELQGQLHSELEGIHGDPTKPLHVKRFTTSVLKTATRILSEVNAEDPGLLPIYQIYSCLQRRTQLTRGQIEEMFTQVIIMRIIGPMLNALPAVTDRKFELVAKSVKLLQQLAPSSSSSAQKIPKIIRISRKLRDANNGFRSLLVQRARDHRSRWLIMQG